MNTLGGTMATAKQPKKDKSPADKRCCLYLRYSSSSQTEQSIEGQHRVCSEYCERNGLDIVDVYVDRATSARSVEKRDAYKKMMGLSGQGLWGSIIVYKLDRFSRDRINFAIARDILKKNGVRLVSATENISDAPEGIIFESLLEGLAEYYSAELSQKIKRGKRESAMKGKNTGCYYPLGYKGADGYHVIDPLTAPLVKEAFERYAEGEKITDIYRDFNARGYRTPRGAEFNRSSFRTMFGNENYIGVYKYMEIRIEDKIPPIIENELFEKVQKRLEENNRRPPRGRAKVDYLLSGKIICGHCESMMNGETGTSKSGKPHNYYMCFGRKKKNGCTKKNVRKDDIELMVVENAFNLLTDEKIEELAEIGYRESVRAMKEDSRISELTKKIAENNKAIDNLSKAILLSDVVTEALPKKVAELESENKALGKEIQAQASDFIIISKKQIIHWLEKVRSGDVDSEHFKKTLLNVFVNTVIVRDENDGYVVTTTYNLTDIPADVRCSDVALFME